MQLILLEMRYKNLKQSLTELMQARRWSLYRLSKEVPGTTYHTLRNLIQGNTQEIQEDTIKAIEEGLEISIDVDGNISEKEKPPAAGDITDDTQATINYLRTKLDSLSENIRKDLAEMLDHIEALEKKEKAQKKH